MSAQDLDNRFDFYPANTKIKQDLHSDVRVECKALATFFDESIPDSREKSLAITKIEEAMFWANAGIARFNIEPTDQYSRSSDG